MGATPHFEARGVARMHTRRAQEPIMALAAISFALPRGSFCAVLGPSGCGKTTLLRLLAALDRPTHGEVLHDGRALSALSGSALSGLRRGLGLVFQDPRLVARLPIWENVALPLIPIGVARRERYRRALRALEEVGIEGIARQPPDAVSGGERQRVGVARALVAEPAAVLADEPTAHLDQLSASAVRRSLGDRHRNGVTVVVATHDAALVDLADETLRP